MKLNLTSQTPLASSTEKEIYQHPDKDELLIKIWQTKYLDFLKQQDPIQTSLRRLPKYTGCLKEITEHLYIREKGEESRFVQNIVGLIDTDLGMGVVVEKITQKNGQLAQNLTDVIANNHYHLPQEQAMSELIAWLRSTGVIIRDLTLRNLVWDECNSRFVIVDGLGGKARCSLRSFSSWYNRRSNNKRADKLLFRIERAKLRLNKSKQDELKLDNPCEMTELHS